MTKLGKINLENLKGNFFINNVNEDLLVEIAQKAAKKRLHLYVYSTSNKAPWGLVNDLTVIATKEPRKRKCWVDNKITYNNCIYVYLERARECKTERGAVWRLMVELSEKLD